MFEDARYCLSFDRVWPYVCATPNQHADLHSTSKGQNYSLFQEQIQPLLVLCRSTVMFRVQMYTSKRLTNVELNNHFGCRSTLQKYAQINTTKKQAFMQTQRIYVDLHTFFGFEQTPFFRLVNPNCHGGRRADSAPPTSHLLIATKIKKLAL